MSLWPDYYFVEAFPQPPRIYLHGVGFSWTGLSVSEDAHIIAVNAGRDQRLHFLKHLFSQERDHKVTSQATK